MVRNAVYNAFLNTLTAGTAFPRLKYFLLYFTLCMQASVFFHISLHFFSSSKCLNMFYCPCCCTCVGAFTILW